jgi:hypothetical protein
MIAEVWRFTFHDKRPLLQGKFSAMPINAIYCSVLLLNRRACTLSLCLIFGFSAICREANAQLLSIYAEDFVKATFQSPETVWEPAISAGGSVAWNDFVSPIEGFSSGWKGYGHHYAVALADNVNGKFMRDFVLAAASHQEDNYSPPKSDTFWKRIGYAALHTFVVAPDDSSKKFNWSGVPASLASASLSNAYQPAPQRTWAATFERAGTSTAGYAVGNVWDVIAGALKDRHARVHVLLKNR